MSCLLKSVLMDYNAFRHPSLKGDAGFATKTLVCIAQSAMSDYTEVEVLCAGTCTTTQHITEMQIG